MPGICQLCLGGPQSHKAPGYGIWVCTRCWRDAERGWKQSDEPQLRKALAAAGLLIPDRNEQGLLPREYAPPADFKL